MVENASFSDAYFFNLSWDIGIFLSWWYKNFCSIVIFWASDCLDPHSKRITRKTLMERKLLHSSVETLFFSSSVVYRFWNVSKISA